MPVPLLNEYAENLPRVTAEESLLAAERTAVGSGSLKKGEGRRIAREWQRAAQQGAREVVLRPKTEAEYAAYMAMSGIAVKRVKRTDG